METINLKAYEINQEQVGWSVFRNVIAEDLNIYTEAMRDEFSEKYTPELVSTRTTGGNNYRFICSGIDPLSNKPCSAIIEINSTDDYPRPTLMSITRVNIVS